MTNFKTKQVTQKNTTEVTKVVAASVVMEGNNGLKPIGQSTATHSEHVAEEPDVLRTPTHTATLGTNRP